VNVVSNESPQITWSEMSWSHMTE